MTVNYTTNLALGQPVTGTESGTWGDDVNNAVTSYLDIAIAGGLAITVTTADVTLTLTQGTSSATNIGSTTAQYAILNVSGAMTAARSLIVPSSSRIYLINNNTTGGFALTVKGSATSGVTLVNGEKAQVFWNGSDYAKLSNASGGAGVFSSITNSGLTSGRVVYSTTGGLETDSANLTFNGTTLTAGGLTTTGTTSTGVLSVTGNTTLGDASTDTVTVNGYLGVGTVGATTTAIRVRYVPTGGTIGYAVNAATTFAADVTNIAISGAFGVTTTASAYTLGTVRTIDIADATKGAGSTITNQNGVYINDLTSGTNNYGITSAVTSGTNKWNIYASGTAANYFAGVVQFAAGSAAAPALTRFGDENTGIFFPAADTIAFSEGGAEAMRIDANGRLVVGGTTPNTSSNITGTNTGAGITYGLATYNATAVAADVGSGVLFSGGTAGNGLGGIVGAFSGAATTDGGYLAFQTRAVTSGVITERMRIDSAGNVQVQTGAVVVYQPTPAAISTGATLTNANLQTQLIDATGGTGTFTLTMPLGTTLETLVSWSAVNLGYDFSIICNSSQSVILAVNTGVTSVGTLVVSLGTSARFRIRRTAANTFVLYRIS